MTKQKVITQLEDLKEYCNEMSKQWESDVIALNIAIETLQNDRCEKFKDKELTQFTSKN
jgi:hypothetical protein